MLPYAIGGTALWGVLGLALLLFGRDWLAGQGHENWLGICLAGFLIGFLGIATMIRHDANRRRRLSAPLPADPGNAR